MLNKLFILLLVVITFVETNAQSPYILRGDQSYHSYDRLEILQKNDTFLINSIGNINRKEMVQYLQNQINTDDISGKDLFDIKHILADNYEFLNATKQNTSNDIKTGIFTSRSQEENSTIESDIFSQSTYQTSPILKYFYKTAANFYQLETPSFTFFVNPVLQLGYHHQVNNENIVFQNTRGIEARGYIDQKVYFYTQLLENQRSYLSYIDERIQKFNTLPGQGFWKPYSSTVLNNLNGYDFFNTRAYIGFNPVKSINIEFGHGNHFIGNGIRSLLLSDYSHNYLYLKFNTKIWKFQYQNIFAELLPTTSVAIQKGDKLLPKKYMATHYLAFKPNHKFEIGVFESVVFARQDHFEFQYLNPVILYRSVEHTLGSPDNVLLGLNTKWNPVKGISIYGQVILDEFKLSEVKKQSGWWANKFGGQMGIKYINALGIDHLDMQMEYNAVRPYTYSHRDTLASLPSVSVANYSHSNQPLAHPLGANFKELIFTARYKPYNKIYVLARALMTSYGDDKGNENWGGNILLPHETRVKEYGNVIGQGNKTKVTALNMDVSYELYHNYFVDLQAMWRQSKTDLTKNQHYIGGGIRVNISNINYDY
jgi:hypothetical protein